MAKFNYSGINEIIKQLEQISTLDNGKLAKTMLKEGSKPIVEKWKSVAGQVHNKHTGQMREATAAKAPRKNKKGRFIVSYPLGLEEYEYKTENGTIPRIRHGQVIKFRNAEKAFFNHYGFFNVRANKFVIGTRWVDRVEDEAEPLANKKMQEIWDSYIKSKK